MFDTLLIGMKQMAEAGLKERKSFRAMWYKEWADLFLNAYEPGRKVVYTSIYAFPMEILAAFDVSPFDFEIAGALMSVMNMGTPLMENAEEKGYSHDICSFHRASLGGCFASCFPAPDLLISTSFYCDGKAKVNDIIAYHSGKDSFFLYVPHEITRDSVQYVKNQLMDAAGEIARISGQKFDQDKLKEAVRSSNRSRNLMLQIHEIQRSHPAVFSVQDHVGYSINGQLFSGRETKESLETHLLHEMKEKLSSGNLKPEKHRLFWFAWIPVYPSNLFTTLKDHQVTVPMCETSRIYWDEIDEDDPFEGLALKCLKNPFIGPTARRVEGMDKIVDEYAIDGALLFATPACRNSKSAHMMIKDTFSKLGIPFIMLDMDISDPRSYQPEQIKTRLESFIEVMENRRALTP